MDLLTKGKMIKALNQVGVRTGNKYGAEVHLSHLKTSEITKLYLKYVERK